jgi:REP element-mobilizing transposase RayT
MVPEKFRNKYRIVSHRKPGWDYSSDGFYFITLVTQNRVCNMGEIVVDADGRPFIKLSGFGKIVDAEWHKSFEIRDELFLDTYIIMPNHLHAILVIDKNEKIAMIENGLDTDAVGGDTADTADTDITTVATTVDTHGRAYLRSPSRPFYRLPKSISSFLAGFKSAVNSKIDDYIDQHNLNIPKYNRNNHFFQPNYYDHIIRNEQSYQTISEYITNNPVNWKNDKLHKR